MPLCTATSGQARPTIVPDGAGGAIVTWEDFRSGTSDIYAQRILAAGTVQWTANGVPLCTAADHQMWPTIVSDGAGGAIVTWEDWRSGTNNDIYAQRVNATGQLGSCEASRIQRVKDIPNDQGGKVEVSWYASCLDAAPDFGIAAYWIWRSVPPNYAALALARGARLMESDETVLQPDKGTFTTSVESGRIIFWEYVGSQVAAGDDGYSYVLPTTSDSLAGSNPYTLVRVQARASSGSAFWNSAPDSGYSVDNLAPPAPAPFTGRYASGTATLHWGLSTAPDFATFKLYRGGTSGFVPGPGNLVVAQSDTGYVDSPGALFYYKLCAVDVHGNVSGFTLLLPTGTTDVPIGASLTFALEGVRPNPSHGERLSVVFALPSAAPARLELLDVSGRRVAEREVGALGPGRHIVDLATDQRLAPGLYLVRLTQGANVRAARAAVID